MYLNLLLFLIPAIAMAFIILTFVRDYIGAVGTPWARALTACRESATVLWSKFVLLIGFATTGLVQLADYLGDPGLADAIKGVLQPQYVGPFLLVVTFITLWARMRTLPPKA